MTSDQKGKIFSHKIKSLNKMKVPVGKQLRAWWLVANISRPSKARVAYAPGLKWHPLLSLTKQHPCNPKFWHRDLHFSFSIDVTFLSMVIEASSAVLLQTIGKPPDHSEQVISTQKSYLNILTYFMIAKSAMFGIVIICEGCAKPWTYWYLYLCNFLHEECTTKVETGLYQQYVLTNKKPH